MSNPSNLFVGISNQILAPFQIQHVDHNDPKSKSSNSSSDLPPLGILEYFKGTFEGPGFNLIFRPNGGPPSTTTFPTSVEPHSDNVLELNLSTETLVFGSTLGSIPNRGLAKQSDIFMNGVSYVQTVSDVTNSETGKADGPATTMHFEPGLWVYIPPNASDPSSQESLARMASIPHGTTINAQCQAPVTSNSGQPQIPPVDITPHIIDGIQNLVPVPQRSQNAADSRTARIPQDLSKFVEAGSITPNILTDPNTVLRDSNRGKTILKTISFTVSTYSTNTEQGGGTTNIAFLRGAANMSTGNPLGDAVRTATRGPLQPNAEAGKMHATFWISTVQHSIIVPPFKHGQPALQIKPSPPYDGALVPTFEVTPPAEIVTEKTIVVESTQIQYSQTVFLNFNGLTWPHVSVATLVPDANNLQRVPDSVWN